MNYCNEVRAGRGGVCSIPKPPLGLPPRRLWLEARFQEVSAAITRYKKAGLEIPIEWYEEFFELVEVLY